MPDKLENEVKKRYRRPKAKPNQLLMKYGRLEGEDDIVIAWGDCCNKADAYLLYHVINSERMCMGEGNSWGHKFTESLVDELEKRGYDPKTLKFSIEKKETSE